jgi:gluconokinase
MASSQAIIVMGPSGCGKSTVGSALSVKTGWPMVEGDDHHPRANIAKMSAGEALTDDDRAAWLDQLVAAMDGLAADTIVVSCSALTPYVQSRLIADSCRTIRFVLLDLTRDQLAQRLGARADHFMAPELLDSQLEALSVPDGALIVSAEKPVDELVDTILAELA